MKLDGTPDSAFEVAMPNAVTLSAENRRRDGYRSVLVFFDVMETQSCEEVPRSASHPLTVFVFPVVTDRVFDSSRRNL